MFRCAMSTTDIVTETTTHRTVPGSHTGYAPSPSPFEQARGVSERALIGSSLAALDDLVGVILRVGSSESPGHISSRRNSVRVAGTGPERFGEHIDVPDRSVAPLSSCRRTSATLLLVMTTTTGAAPAAVPSPP